MSLPLFEARFRHDVFGLPVAVHPATASDLGVHENPPLHVAGHGDAAAGTVQPLQVQPPQRLAEEGPQHAAHGVVQHGEEDEEGDDQHVLQVRTQCRQPFRQQALAHANLCGMCMGTV